MIRKRAWSFARALVCLVCAAVTSYGIGSLVLRLFLAAWRTDGAWPRFRIILWNPIILTATIAGLLWLLIAPRRRESRTSRRMTWGTLLAPWLVVAGVLGIGLAGLGRLGVPAPQLDATTGLIRLLPQRCYAERRGRDNAVQLCTNKHGLRGPDWELATKPGDGRRIRRVLIAGDSYVFGSGVDESGTLHAALAAELARVSPEVDWRIVNVGFPGLSFPSYVRMIEGAAQAVKPDVVVIGFNKGNDLDTADIWTRLETLGEPLLLLSVLLGAERDVNVEAQTAAAGWRDETQVPATVRACFDRALDRLLVLQRQGRWPVLIWSYYGSTTLFERAVAERGTDVLSPDDLGWMAAPGMHIAGDGHPTAAANAAFAKAISVWVMRQTR